MIRTKTSFAATIACSIACSVACCILCIMSGIAAPLAAQTGAPGNTGQPTSHTDSVVVVRTSPVLRASKWTALALSAGAAAYGFSQNRSADKDYTALEEMCIADRENCARRSGQAYADAELERRYQAVRARDDRARLALLGSQLGVAATVVLFVIDLRHNRPPKDIPYTPRSLDLVPGRDGSLQLRLTLPLAVDQRQH